MKPFLIALCSFVCLSSYSQGVAPPQPVEERYHFSYWWWLLGVLIAIGIGVLIYMMIKKDPKRDAVR
jgi:phosphotransferase system  glucose/maltose/N-acetylglucosamine-specific IIC component